MASFCKIIILGHLTRAPELRYTPKGTAVARFDLAVNRQWTSESGEKKEEVSFIKCDAFGRTAEVIGQYCKKGHPLLVEGRIKQENWEDKNTHEKKSALKVVVESFTFIPTGNRDGDTAAPRAQRPAAGAAPAAEPVAGDGPPEDEDPGVPF